MPPRNQNRPPRSPSAKKEGVGSITFDKRRKLELPNTGRRQALSAVNRADVTATSDVGGTEENIKTEYTKEEVEALLNERLKAKQFDSKGKIEQMGDLIKRLKHCLRWFRQAEENHIQEMEDLKNALDLAKKRLVEKEEEMRTKEEQSNNIVSELKETNASLEQRASREESEKQDALENYKREKEERTASEMRRATLQEELDLANKKTLSLEDNYKRLQEYNTSLQHYNSRLQKDLEAVRDSLSRIEKEKASILENLSTLRGHNKSLQEQLTLSRDTQDKALSQNESLTNEVQCLRKELQQARDDRDCLASKVQALNTELERQEKTAGKSVQELGDMVAKLNCVENTCSSQREQICILEHQLTAANEKLKMADLSESEARTGYEEQKRMVREMQERLVDTERQLLEGEKLRKKLHNTILELKGNIRVFCRVRPLLPEDGAGQDTAVISYPTSVESLGRGVDLVQPGHKYPFTFDKVFNQEASQEDVFVEISQLVQSALDGYKVCIFAYGQTGSGKTYTMMGTPETSEQKGLIPRSLEQIFQSSQTLSSQGWKYKLQASMLEIYNETIRDLLSLNRPSASDMARAENGIAGKYTIKHDPNGNTVVSDLTVVEVSSITEVSSLLQRASQSRAVGKTQMNEESSRSHFVFTLRISGLNENTEQQVQGVLNLIDLAGSERLSRSGATGDRLKETQAINKSLSALSDVILALAKKDEHVPYRNSKLTYLLQPCLGGDSKTLMFVNVSPDPSSAGETLCSLRFAAKVNACEIGIPRRQTSMRAIDSRLSCG